MSGSKDREQRREGRLREEESAAADERRQRAVKLASAAAFLAIAVVAVLIVVSQSGDGGDAEDIGGAAEVRRELAGIPQSGMVLGEPSAPVTLIEFGDLQCPVCKGYAEEVIPQVIENRVRRGEAKLDFRNFTIIGPESITAGIAAVAAGQQGRGWNFVELFYRNQGLEASGYVTDEFLTAIARDAGVPDLARWNKDRRDRASRDQVARTTREAERLGLGGTPSFAVVGPGSDGFQVIGTPGSANDLIAAIDAASE